MELNWTEIVLAVLTIFSTGGWMVNRYKARLDLSTNFVQKFRELISDPIEAEVKKLRNEVNRLKHAIEKVNDCPYRADCPVRKQLHYESPGDHKDADQQPNG